MGYLVVMETVTATKVNVQLTSSTVRDSGEKVPIHINQTFNILLKFYHHYFLRANKIVLYLLVAPKQILY